MLSYSESVAWIDAIDVNLPTSLTDVKALLKELPSIIPKQKIITITGTNGKGSSCYLLESCLLAEGYKVATFTSPHFIEITERVRINGVRVAPEQFASACTTIKHLLGAKQVGWFGTLFLIACAIFSKQTLDYLILEVGIGGRLDATNALCADIAVITTIDYDHQERLGDDRDAIGLEKAGLFRPGKIAVIGDENCPDSVIQYGEKVNSRLVVQGVDFTYNKSGDLWSWKVADRVMKDLPVPNIPLQNASTVFAVLSFCDVSDRALRHGLENCFAPGRCQQISSHPAVICDVAHNPQSAHYLRGFLENNTCEGKTYAVFAMKTSKDAYSVSKVLMAEIDHWLISDCPDDTGFVIKTKHYLQDNGQNVIISENILDSWQKAQKMAAENDRIVVFGSFMTVGAVLQYYGSS
jgi:dihydrofolate synthase / folylpolyglutamate synthase